MGGLTEVESDAIDIEEAGEKEALLVGRLVTKKNWNPSNLIETITKVWKPKHGMRSRVLEESKLILFLFDDAIERDWILKHQPWIFKDSLFAIKKFNPSSSLRIDHASFWVRLYEVPFPCMNERSLRLFAKRIGVLESVDKSGEDSIGTFIRFKVSINIKKPLLRGITIRMKRKHLWLPLKYESLPIYCFSCGTIGHDHSNCQSSNYNRNMMKYSTCKFRASSSKSTFLPHDIIENILSRLPVKHLLRFKVVSKQWEATISSPRFAEIHLQRYKNSSSSQNLVAWDEDYDFSGFYVAKLQNTRFEFVSIIIHSREEDSSNILCYCDGLYLKCAMVNSRKMFVLCNPSCRAYKEFLCPRPIEVEDIRREAEAFHGIYYNPLTKDYKVVVSDDAKNYAIFSCRHNKWSGVKEMKDIVSHSAVRDGVSLDGSLYWLSGIDDYKIELIFFDWRDENFKKLPIPDRKGRDDECINLTSSGRHLWLSYINRGGEMRIMQGNGKDQWMELFKVQLRIARGYSARPICWVIDGIIIDVGQKYHYMLYNPSKNTFAVIPRNPSRKYSHPVPYLENLFLQ